jgi:hypothetical protein
MSMRKQTIGVGLALTLIGMSAGVLGYTEEPAKPEPPAPKAEPVEPVNANECFSCHANIEEFHTTGRHATVNCAHCHDAVEHAEEADEENIGVRPVTRTDPTACASCHLMQYNSFVEVNLNSKARVEKASFKSRSPMFDKLIAGHGFAKEHAEPRSHVFMLIDHYIVDRAYGGRFQLKDWTHIADGPGAASGAWSILTDKEPETNEQKVFLPQTATAANPVCLNCKTQDHILLGLHGRREPERQVGTDLERGRLCARSGPRPQLFHVPRSAFGSTPCRA